MEVAAFLPALHAWAQQEERIWGILLVGSHARGEGRPESDVDVILFTESPSHYLADTSWTENFGAVQSRSVEDWGMLFSVRTFFTNRLEVEFGITSSRWLAEPLDEGTRRVLTDGYRIIYDPQGTLAGISGIK